MNKLQENEQLVISTMLKSPNKCKIILNNIENIDYYFTISECRTLIKTIKELNDAKNIIDLETVNSVSKIEYSIIKEIYDKYGEIEEANILSHLRILRSNALDYDLTNNIFKQISITVSDSKDDVEAKVQKLSEIVKSIEDRKYVEADILKDMTTLVNDHLSVLEKRKQGLTFYTTGDKRLDDCMTYGYAPKEITIIAGRPSNGKSLFRLDNARKLANLGIPVAIFNLEMRNESDMDRLIAMSTQIEATRLVKDYNSITDKEHSIINNELDRMKAEMSMFMSDKPTLSIEDIKSNIGKLQDKLKKEYIVVYFDLATKLMEFGEADSALDFEKNCNIIQRATRKMGIHSVLILQINRSGDRDRLTNIQDVNKIYPRISSIKNSGAFEEVGDNIFLICKPSNYLKQYEWGEYVPDYMRIEIAKQRQGATTSGSNVLLYKTNNNYLGLIEPEENWDPLEVNISEEDLRRYR